MKNDVMNLPFPDNLFADLGKMQPVQQAEDFIGTLMYVLRTVASARDARVVMMRYQSGKSFEEIASSTERDHFLTPEEAMDLGLIDRVLVSRKDLMDDHKD